MIDDEALMGYHAEGMGKVMTTIELAARMKEKYAEHMITLNAEHAMSMIYHSLKLAPQQILSYCQRPMF